MTATVTSWRDIPADKLIRLLGENGDGFHPRDICDPAWIHDKFGIPLELLPVDEIVADADRGIHLERNGKPVACMQGIVAGDLIDAIAEDHFKRRDAILRAITDGEKKTRGEDRGESMGAIVDFFLGPLFSPFASLASMVHCSVLLSLRFDHIKESTHVVSANS